MSLLLQILLPTAIALEAALYLYLAVRQIMAIHNLSAFAVQATIASWVLGLGLIWVAVAVVSNYVKSHR